MQRKKKTSANISTNNDDKKMHKAMVNTALIYQ